MFHLSKLKNKATLITVPVTGTEATTVLVLFPVGSRYETAHLSGVSHFVEHLMFKGTNRRPGAQDIARTVEIYGAAYNAFTFKDFTGYFVKIDSAKFTVACDLLSDMLFDSKFDATEIEREKGVIVEELRMYEDNPIMAVEQLFDRITFGDTPLGRDIGGTAATVRGLSREDLWNYYKSAYRPENMVVVAAGKVDKTDHQVLEKYFGTAGLVKKTPGKTFAKNNFDKFVWPKNIPTRNKRVLIETRKVDQAQVILGFPGLPHDHRDSYSLSLLLHILGGGMTSRLFVEVRERRGLAYMVRAGGSTYRDVGVVQISAGLDPKRLPEAIKVIRVEVEKMAAVLVTENELEEAKTNMLGRLTLALEDSSFQADWFAKQFWFDKKMESFDVIRAKISQVKAIDIRRLAKQIFDWRQVRAAAIGPIQKDQILKMF